MIYTSISRTFIYGLYKPLNNRYHLGFDAWIPEKKIIKPSDLLYTGHQPTKPPVHEDIFPPQTTSAKKLYQLRSFNNSYQFPNWGNYAELNPVLPRQHYKHN